MKFTAVLVVFVAILGFAKADMSKFSGVDLTSANWDETKEGTWFIKFYAPWCGHCKRMHAAWEQLAKANPDANIARVDCTDKSNRPACSEQGVRGFPTVKVLRDGVGNKYSGKRTK